MAWTNILIFLVLCANVFSGVTANCESGSVQKCADIVKFMADRSSVIGGTEMLDELCSFNENVTNCANDTVLKCPNLKDDEYETLIRVTSKINKEVCTNGSDIQRAYMKHKNCLSTIDENAGVKCVQEFIVILNMLKDTTTRDMCCTFSQSKTCIHDLVLSKCGNEAANATTEIADLLSSPLTESRCGTFNYTICSVPQSSSSLTPALLLVFLFNILLLVTQW